MKNFVEELRWRGMLHDMMPGLEELLSREQVTAYVGIDPTADSLHIGHMVSIMMLRHLQACGHKPLAVLGGATGMIGDPSMKSSERNLLDEQTLRKNQECIKKQLYKFLDFDPALPNRAELLNNYDWTKDYTFLDFVRDIGKHITVNYMMSKDSVKKRISGEEREGMSFTEFTYQLLQGYDFLHLYNTKNCKLQMGGSDQWGNITTGAELIRRKCGGDAYALTCPLITKADGGKFGKTETGNVWLDPARTSPYAFYQFWLNVSDDDAARYIKIFTMLQRDEIDALITAHAEAPHRRELQKKLAQEITSFVHSETDYRTAVEASQILFGNTAKDTLQRIDEPTFLAVFDGVPIFDITADKLPAGITDLLVLHTPIFPSKGECRKMIQGGGLSLNKEKITDTDLDVDPRRLINNRYLLIQKGRKQYFIIRVK
ncbi:MAG: tyrosine--tRNA ligase [Prevotellaceae bacterium]|jgi:tyrosyl-tRNA synthetase|nr:tyrosine--tRNA ligase [Prevotellaceae bacterium]